MMPWRRTLVLCLLCLWATPGIADQFDEVRGWLERMAEAMREQDYQGTFVYVRGDDVETIRVTHLWREGQILERLVALSGPQREVVRDGEAVRASLGEEGQPVEDPILTGGAFPDFSIGSIDKARDRYSFEMGGEDRIANYQAIRLSITPLDRYRFGYELWVEPESALLLRWVLYDADRRPLARLMFTDLVTGEAVDAEAVTAPLRMKAESAMATAGQAPVQEAVAAPSVGPAWHVPKEPTPRLAGMHLPPGFSLAAHALNIAGPDTEHLLFSDGLASVSVYLEPDQGGVGVPEGLSRMGTTNAWSHRQDDRRVTVIGEVPPVTLKSLGKAFVEADNGE